MASTAERFGSKAKRAAPKKRADAYGATVKPRKSATPNTDAYLGRMSDQERTLRAQIANGGQSLGMTFRDPTRGIIEADPVEMLTGMPLTDGQENYDALTRTALTGAAGMATPRYLQEGYEGPQTGLGPVGDFAAGLGQVFQGGSGAGSMGAPALAVSQFASDIPDAGRALGTMGGTKVPRGLGNKLSDLRPIADAARTEDVFNRQFPGEAPAGMGRIVDPKESLRTVIDSNFTGPTKVKPTTFPIDKLNGSMSAAADDTARANSLAQKIASPDGYFERIIVDGNTGDVIEGQHRLAAARKLGVKDVPVLAVYDATHGMPVAQMKSAISRAQKLPSDHVNGIVNRVAEAINDAGSVDAVRAQYDPPKGFEAAWNAALDAAQLGPQS